ncbi:MAG: ATP synthase F1 subunit delta [Bacteroidetes bacterium]|nr:ATP synthase F1 subunit delta [Bacteroidota bacterium]
MNESQISVRYAKALFQSASEKQILEQVNSDMELLSETCKQEELQYMLVVPTLQPGQKVVLMEKLFKSHVNDASMSLISLVIKNKRDVYLPGIARNFRDLYRKAMKISSATLLTAEPVEDAALKSIKEMLAKAYDAKVELSTEVDKEVIGGFVLTIEDMQYDASVSTSLRKFRKQLLQTR